MGKAELQTRPQPPVRADASQPHSQALASQLQAPMVQTQAPVAQAQPCVQGQIPLQSRARVCVEAQAPAPQHSVPTRMQTQLQAPQSQASTRDAQARVPRKAANSKRLVVAEWVARICFGVVFFWNILCAAQFVFWPADYAPGFGLSGQAGNVAIAGLGIAFLMWNVTFPAFIVYPTRFMCLGVVAIVQQIIGIVGEDWILLGLAARMHLDAAIERFLFFDVTGLLLMTVSFVVLMRVSNWRYSPFGHKHTEVGN